VVDKTVKPRLAKVAVSTHEPPAPLERFARGVGDQGIGGDGDTQWGEGGMGGKQWGNRVAYPGSQVGVASGVR